MSPVSGCVDYWKSGLMRIRENELVGAILNTSAPGQTIDLKAFFHILVYNRRLFSANFMPYTRVKFTVSRGGCGHILGLWKE